MILLDITDRDREKLDEIIPQLGIDKYPNLKMSIYKNRGGAYNKCYIWMFVDKGICRFDGMFATDWQYNPLSITPLTIEVDD